MRLRLFIVVAAVSFAAAELSVPSRRSAHASLKRRRPEWTFVTNQTAPIRREYVEPVPEALEKRDGQKYVFMHHIVGNTYSYLLDDWKTDLSQIAAKGIDAVALNIGSSEWQKDRVADAYEAAKQLGNNPKLFISVDFTEFPSCNLGDILPRITPYKDHSAQFKYNGKTFISSYSGGCLGNDGWASLKSQINGYAMPFIWSLEGQFNNWPSLDSWYCWGCAWPNGNTQKTWADDDYYHNQLQGRFATTVSGWMYTQLASKSFYQRGDDHLIARRWQQLVTHRNDLTFVEMVTWNDWGESDYFGPIRVADQPDGTTWVNGYPHVAWFDMSEYFIKAFKTGSYPAITKDTIYFWARPHPAAANPTNDNSAKPSGWDWTPDTMWAVVLATGPATVVLKCGSNSQTFTVGAGLPDSNFLSIPLSAGKMTVQLKRNDQTLIDYTPPDYTYVTSPAKYNYNAWVGSASYGDGSSTPTTPPPSTPSTPSSPSSNGFSYVGCYQDDNSRVLSAKSTSDPAMTVAKCQSTCSGSGYSYAGVEYGIQCYCANTIKQGAVTAAQNQCAMKCGGDSSQTCGDGWRIEIYQATSSSSTPTTPSTPSTPSWTSYGCVAEGTTGSRRALTGASFSQSNMTPQVCQNLCSSFQYAGVEYGSECYCGNSLTNNAATGTVIASSNCNSNCAGDSSQKCGGTWTMNVYKSGGTSGSSTSTAWSSAGCYVDADTRMLRGSYTRSDGMTNDMCISSCTNGGYTMAGTQDGKECFCGSQAYKEGGAGVLASSPNQCSTQCSGNSGQICGGGWRMTVFTKPGTTI